MAALLSPRLKFVATESPLLARTANSWCDWPTMRRHRLMLSLEYASTRASISSVIKSPADTGRQSAFQKRVYPMLSLSIRRRIASNNSE